jgi:hypothetical protein
MLAINMLMFAVLWDALRSDTPGLSENATQVVIAAFGGVIGLLGAYLGARAVERSMMRNAEVNDESQHGGTARGDRGGA